MRVRLRLRGAGRRLLLDVAKTQSDKIRQTDELENPRKIQVRYVS